MSGLVASALPGEHYCKTLWSTVLPDSRVACMWSAAAARALLARSSSDSTSRVEPCHLKMERGAVMRKRGGDTRKGSRLLGTSTTTKRSVMRTWNQIPCRICTSCDLPLSPSLPPPLHPPAYSIYFTSCQVKREQRRLTQPSKSHLQLSPLFFFHALILTLLLALSLSCYTNPEP